MQAPSLFVLSSHATDSLSLSDLSDQTLMEMLIEHMEICPSDQFRDETGAYKEVCKWPGVQCNGRRRVKHILWLERYLKDVVLRGTVDFRFMPQRTRNFVIYAGDEQSRNSLFGTIDTAALPRGLSTFFIPYQRFHGTIDFRRLPLELESLRIQDNRFEGSIHLNNLPKKLKQLHAHENRFSGSLILKSLPDTLESLNASHNQLFGSLCLRNLPRTLEELKLENNSFSGSVSFDALPDGLKAIDLSSNSLRGEFVLLKPPNALTALNAQGNQFSPTAMIARRAHKCVALSYNYVKRVVDEYGVGRETPKRNGVYY